jgi:hypothetical protein
MTPLWTMSFRMAFTSPRTLPMPGIGYDRFRFSASAKRIPRTLVIPALGV